MRNPIGMIAVYEITGALKNPFLDNAEWSHAIVPITWSKSRVARAWWGYSDNVIATAGGYGYDKESTVLASALVKLGVDREVLEAQGVGVETLTEIAARHGVTVKKLV